MEDGGLSEGLPLHPRSSILHPLSLVLLSCSMSRLPLFPLELLLFPGTQASLHIFEERYRALLRDVLAVDGVFGIILPERDGLPATGSIGVRARILTHQPLPDGRSNLLVEGDRRFFLTSLVPDPAPYAVGEVAYFDDDQSASDAAPDAEQQLRVLATRCRKAIATLSDVAHEARWSSDIGRLTFEVAAAMPWDPRQAQQLLAMRHVDERLALLLRLLPGMVPQLEQRAVVHQRASTNGKGPHGSSQVTHE